MAEERHLANPSEVLDPLEDHPAPIGRRFKTDAQVASNDENPGRHVRQDREDRDTENSYQPRHGGSQPLASEEAPSTPVSVALNVAGDSPNAMWMTPVTRPTQPRPMMHARRSGKAAATVNSIPRRSLITLRPEVAEASAPVPVTEIFIPQLARTAESLDTGLVSAPVDLVNLSVDAEDQGDLPSLKSALASRRLSSSASNPWWGHIVVEAKAEMSLWERHSRSFAAASVTALVALVTVNLGAGPNTAQLAATNTVDTLQMERETVAVQAASRSFVRASVATPSTAAPTTTTSAAPTTTTTRPRTTTTKAPVTKTTNPVIPNSYAHCSTSKAAAKECWWPLIDSYSWDTQTAFNIMWCESRGNPNAKNPSSTATGLFQILGGPTDPIANVRQAHTMWSKRGWQPWVCKG